ncbi:alpha/beta hydrolase [Thiocystis minor]|uniref:alpha/beta hydrolase n=1 Tax=Thiocystis minor TaxID=61597 RepID=UPI001F5DB24B|nr:alpha/beta hydrolase [Thiocystis minor]
MNRTSLRQAKFTALFLACLFVSGCTGQAVRPVGTRDLTSGLPAGIVVADGVARSRIACSPSYRVYRPTGAAPGDLAVVGHGFLRAKERMTGLATALAKSGVTTVTFDFCNDRLWDGGHVRNAFDMMAVANALGARRVVYTGFSAGALAALIAARNDRRAVGVVALDLVDAQAMGIRMAAGLKTPLIGLVGDASCCNAFQNGLAVYAVSPSAVVQRMMGADHCDFESPTDWICRLTCARGGAISGSPRQDILRAATAAVQSLLRDAAGSETRGEE